MKKIIVIISILVLGISVKAQQELQFYTMNRALQSYFVNPAAESPYGGHVGGLLIPLLGQLPPAMYLHVQNSAFRYNDVMHYGTGNESKNLVLDIDNFMNEFGKAKSDQIRFSNHLELFNLGFRGKNTPVFWTVNLTQKTNVALALPYDLFELAIHGNGPYMRENKALDFKKLGIDFTEYTELGIGASLPVSSKVRLGIRGKLLWGIANISTDIKKFQLYTDSETYNMTASADMAIRTSIPFLSSVSYIDSIQFTENKDLMDNPFDHLSDILSPKNMGGAVDLGFQYQIIEQVKIFGSVTDLGAIRWANKPQQLVSKGEYQFNGIEIEPLAYDSLKYDNYWQSMLGRVVDTLENTFLPEFKNGKAYTTMLPTNIYFGGEYKVHDKIQVGLLYRGEYFKKNYSQSGTIYLNAPLTSWVSLHASYTIANHTFDNIGAGLTLRGGPFLWYFACDNVFGAILPQKARMTNIRMGLNILFDYKQKVNKPRFKTY